jgi:phosphate transport system substrate-binding protein
MSKGQIRILVLAGAAVAWCLAGSGCRRDQQKTVKLMGSTSIQPFAEELGREYEQKNPGRKIQVEGGGSAVGLQAASSGLADIGTCSRELMPGDPTDLTPVIIARDGVAVIVHPSNPVNGLSTEQIRKMFSGAITNWKEVGGQDAPIRLVTREESSGTREAFIEKVMAKDPIARSSLVQGSNGAVKAVVTSTPTAIGYMSLGQVDKDIKALRVDNEEATTANVLAGKYKLARPFLFVTKGPPKADAQAFIDFVLSAEGQKVLEGEGLIRAK